MLTNTTGAVRRSDDLESSSCLKLIKTERSIFIVATIDTRSESQSRGPLFKRRYSPNTWFALWRLLMTLSINTNGQSFLRVLNNTGFLLIAYKDGLGLVTNNDDIIVGTIDAINQFGATIEIPKKSYHYRWVLELFKGIEKDNVQDGR